MTPQELKASILQLAIQGKLVEQRAEEGTAEELYQQIRQEKQRLVKARGIKKEKPLAEITEDDIPFEIPANWKWIRLGELVRVIGGVSYNKNDVCKNGIRILRGGNIQSMQVVIDDDDVFLPFSYSEPDKQIQAGDILIVASTGSKTVIGKAGYVDRSIPNTMIGAFLRICRPMFGQLIDYIRLLFDSEFYRKHIRDMSQGTNINNVKESYITEFAVPLPPLAEQKRIVAKIEELLPYIDRYEQAWSRLEDFNRRFPVDMQKSILQTAIQGKLVEQLPEEGTGEELYQQIQQEKQRLIKAGVIKKEKPLPEITEDEIPFDIPEGWKWARLGDASWFFDAGKSPNCLKQPVKNDEWGVITTTSIQLGYFDDSQNKILPQGYEVRDSMRVKSGDILITRAGPTNRTGVACLVKQVRYNLILSDKTLRINMTDKHIYKDYIIMVLNSPQIRQMIIGLMSGMDRQQVNISQDKYRTLPLPLPPLAEQKRIVAKLEELLPLCEGLK